MLKRENVVVAHCRVFIEHDFPRQFLHAMLPSSRPLVHTYSAQALAVMSFESCCTPQKHIADEHDHDE